jgi:hypothetical protein
MGRLFGDLAGVEAVPSFGYANTSRERRNSWIRAGVRTESGPHFTREMAARRSDDVAESNNMLFTNLSRCPREHFTAADKAAGDGRDEIAP